MSNIYYDPEKFGLTAVGEVDWLGGGYEFDLTVVWRRDLDGALVYAEDSGCSCPTPFEGQGVADLTACTPASLQAHLEKRGQDMEAGYGYDCSAKIAELMGRVV